MREWLRAYGPILWALVLIYLIFRFVAWLLWPFMIALAIAMLIDPWVGWAERRLRLPRWAATGLILFLVVGLFGTMLSFGIANVVVEIQVLALEFPSVYLQWEERARELSAWYSQWFASLPPALQDQLLERQSDWVESASRNLDNLAVWLQKTISQLPNMLVVLLVAVIATYFFSRDKERITETMLLLVPVSSRNRWRDLLTRFLNSFIGFANAILILVAITSLVTVMGLNMIGSEFALLIGVASGLLDLIPVVGPGLLFVPWSAYHILFGEVWFGVQLLILYGLIAGVRSFLEPRVVGHHLGLHPLAALFGLYVGLRLLGPIGFIVGPLAAVFLKAMYETGILQLDGSEGNGGGTSPA